MRQKITYIPEYQLLAVFLNANVGVIPLACAMNGLVHCDLSYTGELNSLDEVLSVPINFIAFSCENPISKTTLFLINNKSQKQLVNNPLDLFSSQESIVHRHLLGNKNSIYSHKDLLSSDYCLIISYPLEQSKPVEMISKIKKLNSVQMAIEIDLMNYKFIDLLSQDLELYTDAYNQSIRQDETAIKRKKLIKNRAQQSESSAQNKALSRNILRKI